MPEVHDIMESGDQCAGMSPRSAVSDDIAGGSPPGSDDEAGENLNDQPTSQPSENMHTVNCCCPLIHGAPTGLDNRSSQSETSFLLWLDGASLTRSQKLQ